MSVLQSTGTELNQLIGLHLYHSNRSNCSMRVRLCLQEKRLDWHSHHIDLSHRENLTEAYFKVHPEGLVPVLVDEGSQGIFGLRD